MYYWQLLEKWATLWQKVPLLILLITITSTYTQQVQKHHIKNMLYFWLCKQCLISDKLNYLSYNLWSGSFCHDTVQIINTFWKITPIHTHGKDAFGSFENCPSILCENQQILFDHKVLSSKNKVWCLPLIHWKYRQNNLH